MLEKPDIPDRKILTCIKAEYGLQIVQITFLPLGGDLSTAVYRATTENETRYFCKLKRSNFDEISVALPKYLSNQGISQIISPLATKTGQLWADLEEFKLILYPFVEGISGYELELSEGQWAEFGEALKRIHSTIIPSALNQDMQKEQYSLEWREICRNIIKRLDYEKFEDPIRNEWSALLNTKREMILDAANRAEQLAKVMDSLEMEFVPCHSDIHPGNLFIDTKGAVLIVDWDYPMLAPKERDLMFIGGGQGFMPYIAEQEEELFYQGYGQAELDPIALTYYRYERGITDISVESERILSNTLGEQDRAQSLEYLRYYFLPGCTLEMAQKLDKTLED